MIFWKERKPGLSGLRFTNDEQAWGLAVLVVGALLFGLWRLIGGSTTTPAGSLTGSFSIVALAMGVLVFIDGTIRQYQRRAARKRFLRKPLEEQRRIELENRTSDGF